MLRVKDNAQKQSVKRYNFYKQECYLYRQICIGNSLKRNTPSYQF